LKPLTRNVNGGEQQHISHEQLWDLFRGRRPYDKAGPELRGLQVSWQTVVDPGFQEWPCLKGLLFSLM
jgi:hypothetical protein